MSAPGTTPADSRPLAMFSELVDFHVLVVDPAGISALRGTFRCTARWWLGGAVVQYLVRVGDGTAKLPPSWIVRQVERGGNVVPFPGRRRWRS